ncbi:MAG: porin family protein [Campylobacterales bacterium]|nr:porin family protein [Campylobacterales bacterium]
MKKILVSTVATIAIATTQSFAGADFIPPIIPVLEEKVDVSGLYVGLGINRVFFNGTCPCDGAVFEDYTYGALVRVGYDYNQYFGVELRGATTWIEDEGARLKAHYGIFAKPQYHITNDLNIYALAGYAYTEIGDNAQVSFDDTGFSWGVGLEYDLFEDEEEDGTYKREFDGKGDQEKGWGLFVDYQKLIEKDGRPDIDMISFGVTYDF